VRLLGLLEKWSFAWADAIVTVNTACRRLFASRSCGPGKISVVMNAPDGDIFGFQQPRERPANRFVIMYHGSLVERNGLNLAIDALAKIRRSIPLAELRIYGRKTAFLDQVMADVRSRGLDDSVRYLGPRRLEDLVREIEDCDVGIVPNQRN